MLQHESPKVGIVGCGYWGRNLVRDFSELGSLAAICDSDASRLEELRRSYSVAAITRFEEMLAMSEVQAVVIAAPAAQHYGLARGRR
jgi:predicted dehydrogenase